MANYTSDTGLDVRQTDHGLFIRQNLNQTLQPAQVKAGLVNRSML